MKQKLIYTALALTLLILAGFAYYTIMPLFNMQEVQDEMPSASGVGEEANILGPFPVQDTFAHPASGSVSVIETDEGRVLRFENFETINGPQLNLYLATDTDATEYIDLGPIRGTSGNINYVIPDDVDLEKYNHILHWCVPFRVLFNYAQIQQ